MKYLSSFIASSLLFFISTPTWANSKEKSYPKLFLGLKGGYQLASDKAYANTAPSGSVFGVFGGLHIAPSWSWDIGYQLHDRLSSSGNYLTKVSPRIVDSAIRYKWPIKDNINLYSRIGVTYWDVEKSITSEPKINVTGFSPVGEVGADYRLKENVYIHAGYQYIDKIGNSNSGNYDSHSLLIGLTYNFENKKHETIPENSHVHSTNEITNNVEDISQRNEPDENSVKPSFSAELFVFEANSIEVGSTDIDDSFIKTIEKISDMVKDDSNGTVTIVGHTDGTGSSFFNQNLSEQRAQVVADKLFELGVDRQKIQHMGAGENQPIASNKTAKGRAKNRRVEIIVSVSSPSKNSK